MFDLLLGSEDSLVDVELQGRKDRLKDLFDDDEVIMHTPYITTDDPKELRSYHHQQLVENLEGAVMKRVDSPYRGGRKGWSWVKIKEAEGTTGKLTDTLDCIVMGYYAGRGKRAQFGLGAFLVGVYDQEQELIKTIAKIGTGMSDQQLQELKQRGDELAVAEPPSSYQVPSELEPDVWVQPQLVVEIAADELTTSPLHSAGQALRFPRLIKFRDDKDWTQATTLAELDNIQVA
jgi:DNA ligase-1